jgi:hypothetical protein
MVGGVVLVVVGNKLVVVGKGELVVGSLVAVVDVDGLEQPMPAANSNTNTSAVAPTPADLMKPLLLITVLVSLLSKIILLRQSHASIVISYFTSLA